MKPIEEHICEAADKCVHEKVCAHAKPHVYEHLYCGSCRGKWKDGVVFHGRANCVKVEEKRK